LAGNPQVNGLSDPFIDVSNGQYYTGPVEWAAANGIVFGYGYGRFGPDDNITREDLVLILYRYAQFAGIQLPDIRAYTGFTDDANIAGYAKAAVEAFYSAGIVSGYPDGSFKPQGDTTRAETAVMLQGFLALLN